MNDVKEFASPRGTAGARRGCLTLGTYGEEFERRFADYLGVSTVSP
ncbi:MAG TPA: hypothetical protein VFJ49_08400 [Methyloceanibacter sp.]|nr:hypothetical protein [Methyloceanibacter sp.]